MKIQVTQREIDDGEPGNAESCPVALAIMRTLDVDDVRVKYAEIWIEGQKFEAPLKVCGFVENFDDEDGDIPEPFEFDLEML